MAKGKPKGRPTRSARRKVNLVKASTQLALARHQLDKAVVHSWEPTDEAQCVSLAFYAYENAVVAAAEATGHLWTKKHYEKAKLAAKLVADGLLKTDVSEELERLNSLRKDVSYGEAGSELEDADLESVVSDLESYIDEVEGVIDGISEEEDEL